MSKNTMTSTREKNVPFEYENAYEEWSTAGIGNSFLFGKVMTSNPNLLLELLQYSLPEFHIQQIENPEKEADVKLSMDAHGVRLDVITTDDQGRRIDVEMQMRDEKNIPRRMRYYEGSIDQATLEKGQNYNRLGDVVILFITPFDPFDAHGYYKYTFRNTCQEDKEIVLDDGVTKVILNAAGHKWILRGGEAACPAVAEPPVRTDGATRLLTITRVRRGECHRSHALNGLSLDLLHGC